MKSNKILALAMVAAIALTSAACQPAAAPVSTPAPSEAAPAPSEAAPAPSEAAPAPSEAAPAASGKVADIKKAGKLVMACSADFPPYEFHDISTGDDKIAGFDILLANEVAADLGVKLEIRDMDFDGLIAAMQAGTCDMVISGMNATEERKQAVNFSDEYYYADQCILVRKDDAEALSSAEAFKDKTIGAQKGSIQEGIAQEQLETLGAKVFSIANVQGLVLELKSKQVDGVVLDKPIAEAFVRNNADLVISAASLKGDESGFAIAVAKGHEDLVIEINKTLARLKSENKIDAFFQQAVELADNQ